MILKLIEAIDVGYLGKQRLLLKALYDGNLSGHHIFFAKSHLFSFPEFEVREGDLIVLYIKGGEQCTEQFVDATCHFFYSGKWLRLWQNEEQVFDVVSYNQ